ncbi:MAG: ammonium transporter, partial [Opitutaceae bacterium]|jgi:Amt family ammonium transporter
MITNLLKLTRATLFAMVAVCAFAQVKAQDAAPAAAAPAAEAPAAPKDPTVEQRVADLEAYMNNVGRTPDVASKVAGPGPGHNAWMMTCAALVLFMTLPGLALFYGGLVRRKNVLSVLAQCMGITGLVTILWWAVGYSLVFAGGNSPFIGGTKFFFLAGVDSMPNGDYSYWVSQNVFAMYQMMFAIITPALIVGAIAERMKFTAILAFVTLWMFAVYFPLAHMVWGVDGFMNGVWNGDAKIRAIDFAGGTVVHMSSGWSALVLCLILGKRLGFGKESFAPHSMVLTMVGTGMLWVGWYGFNAGSAVSADGIAANAFMTTTIATAVASFVWGALEFIIKKHASVLGFCSGAVAGLVVITPATGFVTSTGAVIIGVFAAIIPFIFVVKLKKVFGYDDALDTFGVHAVGGTLGALLTGFLANPVVNANLTEANGYAKANGLAEIVSKGTLWIEQLKAIGITLALSVIGTVVIAYIVKAVIGLRPTPEAEQQGLDLTDHNEEGYIL